MTKRRWCTRADVTDTDKVIYINNILSLCLKSVQKAAVNFYLNIQTSDSVPGFK